MGTSKIDKCKEIKVHDKVIHDSKREKYLGDIITNNGRNDANIAARKAKGFVIAGDILSILDEVPLGTHRIEAGIVMRNGMLINGILTNSEVWNGLSENDYKELEVVDEYLLRGILESHYKVAKESLYLETGLLPIRYIIKKRRLNYLRHILSRNREELISKIYYAQKRKPLKNWTF